LFAVFDDSDTEGDTQETEDEMHAIPGEERRAL
jgi:hypothetical protein